MKRKFIVEFEYDVAESSLNMLDKDMLITDAFDTIADAIMYGITDGVLSHSLVKELEGTWSVTEVKE